MTDSNAAVALEVAPPPEVAAIAKMSPPQLDAFWNKQIADEAFNSKLFSGNSTARKILDAYVDAKFNHDAAAVIVDAVADPTAAQPVPGGVLHRGMSRADAVTGAQGLLDDGVPLESVGEFEERSADGKPIVSSPEEFFAYERLYNRCLQTPGFLQHPAAKLLMATWGMISTTSRPLPRTPTTGIVR